MYWIQRIGRLDLGSGPLINLTDGGESPKHSKETKKKIGDIHRGKKISDEHKKKISDWAKDNHPWIGKNHSKESIDKMKQSGKLVLDTSTGIYYNTLKQAAEALYPNVKYNTIKGWLNPNKNPKINPSSLIYV